MNIKRLLLSVTIIIFSLSLSSCSYLGPEYYTKNDDKIANACFQKIMISLEKKDKQGLKKIFSSNALKDAKDIDDNIDYIMNFYKGKIKSKDGTIGRSDSKENGELKSELDCMYIVTTDEDKYIVFFIDQIIDTKNPDDVGIYMLQIIKESDRKKEFDWGNKTKCAGIYRPDTAK